MTAIERTEQRLPSQATKGEIELAALKAAGFEKVDPATRAIAVEVANRYGLELMLKHLVAIDGKFYITRDGLLHVAHKTGQLDGIVVEEVGTDGEAGWFAVVSVYRKGMAHPFRFRGRYNGPNKRFGPEMAVKCAEVMGLRRAFDVALAAEDELADRENAPQQPPASPLWSMNGDRYLELKRIVGAKKIPAEVAKTITRDATGGREVPGDEKTGVPQYTQIEFDTIKKGFHEWQPAPPAADGPPKATGQEAPAAPPANPHLKKIQQLALDANLGTPISEAVKLATGRTKPSECTADDVVKFEKWIKGGDEMDFDQGRR